MELVGQAVRDHMLQNGNYEQNLVVLGIAVLRVVAHSDDLHKGATDAKVRKLIRDDVQSCLNNILVCSSSFGSNLARIPQKLSIFFAD
jgi:hypothetical protein